MSNLTITTADGFKLGATQYGKDGDSIIVINSATAVKQRYYEKFARYLADLGLTVITYDYRGIGQSRPASSLAGFQATMTEWGILDAEAVINFARSSYPHRRLCVIGHSFGGQCLGMLPSHQAIDRVVLVASQLAYWGNFHKRTWPQMIFYWYLLFPVVTRLFGYFPGRLGLGEDLPKGVALQWAKWCRSRDYLFCEANKLFQTYYENFSAPILAYKISDDSYAGGDSVERLLARYPQSVKRLIELHPADVGAKSIGHFGLFRETFRDSIWSQIHAWLIS
ncbi:MAG: alpha/beta fold hydrolase [Acidobacteriota bacterium]